MRGRRRGRRCAVPQLWFPGQAHEAHSKGGGGVLGLFPWEGHVLDPRELQWVRQAEGERVAATQHRAVRVLDYGAPTQVHVWMLSPFLSMRATDRRVRHVRGACGLWFPFSTALKADKGTAAKVLQSALTSAAGITANKVPAHMLYRAANSIKNEDHGQYRVRALP